jgi:hypothetical protein
MFSRDLYHAASDELGGVVVIGDMLCIHRGAGMRLFDLRQLNFSSEYPWLASPQQALARATDEVQARQAAGS